MAGTSSAGRPRWSRLSPGFLVAALIAAPCLAGCGDGLCDWTGTWSSSFNTMTLVQSGSTVTGTYQTKSGTVTAVVTGTRLTGTWTQSSSADPMCPSGDFEFTMAADCGSFTGTYWYCAKTSGRGMGAWNGTRK